MALDTGPSLEDFKARLPLADIVGRYVRLVRRGREFVGLCPFHKEKSPSFNVVEEKGFYHCFGCGAHGTAIDFVMAVERLEFPEAIERLAEITGLEAPRRRSSATPPPAPGLHEANEAAAAWFAATLSGEGGREARAYLASRGLDAEAARRFGLGCAPAGRSALKAALLARGFSEQILVEVGLLVRPEDGGDSFDRFRHRLMFPIHDARGRIVGFGGRALGDARAKYLNSPETPLFHKGRLLYNLAQAARPAREAGNLLVAEGYMDVIALVRAGLAHAVAPLGTAITEEQFEILWRLADEPVLCLDGDAAGLRAAHRAAERALPLLRAGRSLRFALLPPGEDPDSLMRGGGAAALAEAVGRPLPLVEFLWRREYAQAQPLDTPERRAALQGRLRELAMQVADREVRGHYLAAFRERTVALWPRREKGDRRGTPPPMAGVLAARPPDPVFTAERRLLEPLLREPALLHEIEEDLAAIECREPRLEKLRQEILAAWSEQPGLDARGLHDHLSRYGFAELAERVLAGGPVALDDGNEQGGAAAHDVWRRMAVPVLRRSAQRRELEALAAGDGQGRDRVGATLGGLDRLLNARDEDTGMGLPHTGRATG
ncbi:DNA primase [Geminicoccaceae bacterium 1502E]|nr:DNA primase [Geminicoccaceae bacterium 1502E]